MTSSYPMLPPDLSSVLSDPEWLLEIPCEKPDEVAFADALLHISNSYQGIRVTADLADPAADPALFVTDLYDMAVGVRRELVNLPHPLDIGVRSAGRRLETVAVTRRVLDMAAGLAFYERTLAGGLWLQLLVGVDAEKPKLGFGVGRLRQAGAPVALTVEICWNDLAGNRYLGGTIPSLRQHHTVLDSVEHKATDLRLNCQLTGSRQPFRLLSRVTSRQEHERFPIAEPPRMGMGLRFPPTASVLDFGLIWGIDTGQLVDIGEAEAEHMLQSNRASWRRRWQTHAIEIVGDPVAQEGIRFSQFSLLQHELPPRPIKISPARGLSSAYHSGATFFDTELHKDAFWCWTEPAVARSHLQFRHSTLAAAYQHAEDTGFRGARFPEAANDLGEPNGPEQVLQYPSGDAVTEWSGAEVIHISADVAYAARRYTALTGDMDFAAGAGADLIVATARFAASAAQPTPGGPAYRVPTVMGPDEYHYHVDNNAFTNTMLAWCLRLAADWVGQPDGPGRSARARLEISEVEVASWRAIASKIVLPPDLPERVPAQHDLYANLPDCEPREPTSGPASRLTADEARLAEALSNFGTKLIKQADLVLLTHLLPERFDADTQARLFDYYEPRTAHGSSLSHAPHGVVAARLGRPEQARAFCLSAARYNLDFQPRSGYANGLHLSAYAGAWQVLVEGLLGLSVPDPLAAEPDVLTLQPLLPASWRTVRVPLHFRGRRLVISVAPNRVHVDRESGAPVVVRISDQRRLLEDEPVGFEWEAHLAPAIPGGGGQG